MNMKIPRYVKLGSLTLVSTLMAACSLPGLGSAGAEEDTITVAGVVSTEGVILTHLVEGLIEHYIDQDVQTVQNLGASTMVTQAMDQGDANVGAGKYTGTSITGELGLDPITDPDKALEVVVEGFAEVYNQKWYPTYGFANTYAFMVTEEVAQEYDLETISDVAPIADQLTAGVDSSWMEREGDGYEAFTEEYFEFGEIYPMQIGLVYDAVETGQMDIVLGYSTDGRIASYDLVVLEDDLNFFPPYDTSPSANYEILEAHPELDDVLLKLEDTIDEETMRQLNYLADDYLLEPATVADMFLEENNYFEEKEPYVEPVEGEESS